MCARVTPFALPGSPALALFPVNHYQFTLGPVHY